MNKPSNSGFTLVEVAIAFAIMMGVFTAALMLKSSIMIATEKAREINIVSMLAQQKIVETENEMMGRTFTELKTEDGGKFEPPYEDYRWTMKVTEVEFPNLIGAGGEGVPEGGDEQMAMNVGKIITSYLSKALREVTITIFWPRGKKETSYSISTYWVNLNNDFSLSQ